MGTVDRRQGSGGLRSAHMNENTAQVNDVVMSQLNQPELTAQSVKYHRIKSFESHLLPVSYKRICATGALFETQQITAG